MSALRPILEDLDGLRDAMLEDEEPCGCADRVKPGEPYHCQICDADWYGDDD